MSPTRAASNTIRRTETLTTLYHLARSPDAAAGHPGVADLLREAGVASVPKARVAVFVGNAWDPRGGSETPWIDIARQLAGDAGVEALGTAARTTPPGTEAIARIYEAAGAPVLLFFDEVLNFLNRHRGMAEPFHRRRSRSPGVWPLASLRQSFLNGSLTRLLDPDATLQSSIGVFVSNGDFGLASGRKPDGGYERVWYQELVAPADVAFDAEPGLAARQPATQRNRSLLA